MQPEEKYIYFDWNVIQYMKEPRLLKNDLDKRFLATVLQLKNKFKFPYSYAHIMDLSHNYSEKYKEKFFEDITFASSINNNFCLTNNLIIEHYSMRDAFDESLHQAKLNNFSPNVTFPLQKCYIDINKLDKNNPMYEFLLENNGMLSTQDMRKFITELGTHIFMDTTRYKNFRNYIQSIDLTNGLKYQGSLYELILMDTLLTHIFPFLDSFNDDENTLKQHWKIIAQKFFSFGKTDKNLNIPLGQLLIHGYVLLDMHPLFKEKLKKGKNTLDNIVRDGNHCFFASKARYFVSEDLPIRKKISFLYQVYGIKTKILNEEEFVNRFDY